MSPHPEVPATVPPALVSGPAGLSGDSQWLQLIAQQNPAVLERLRNHVESSAVSPIQPSIICQGADCPFFKACFLQRENVPLPLGKACPIEETFKNRWAKELSGVLGQDNDYLAVDLGMLIDLVNTQIDIYRAQSELVGQPTVAERVVKGFDPDGNPIIDLRMNPVIFSLRHSRKSKTMILEQLVATRDARSKDKSRKTQDQSNLMAELRGLVDSKLKTFLVPADKPPPPPDSIGAK